MSRLLRALKDIPTSVNKIPAGQPFRCVDHQQAEEYIKTGYAVSMLEDALRAPPRPLEAPAQALAPARASEPAKFPLNWQGCTAVICGSGESLTPEVAEEIRQARQTRQDLRVVAINTSFRRVPFADLLYACDGAWWRATEDKIDTRPFVDQVRELFPIDALWTQDQKAAEEFGLMFIKSKQGSRLSHDPSVISQGMNSVIQAMGLLYHGNVRRILLVGVDCKGKHWHPDHPAPLSNSLPHEQWKKNFAEFAKSIASTDLQVKNCSQGTALKAFPLADLTEELKA